MTANIFALLVLGSTGFAPAPDAGGALGSVPLHALGEPRREAVAFALHAEQNDQGRFVRQPVKNSELRRQEIATRTAALKTAIDGLQDPVAPARRVQGALDALQHAQRDVDAGRPPDAERLRLLGDGLISGTLDAILRRLGPDALARVPLGHSEFYALVPVPGEKAFPRTVREAVIAHNEAVARLGAFELPRLRGRFEMAANRFREGSQGTLREVILEVSAQPRSVTVLLHGFDATGLRRAFTFRQFSTVPTRRAPEELLAKLRSAPPWALDPRTSEVMRAVRAEGGNRWLWTLPDPPIPRDILADPEPLDGEVRAGLAGLQRALNAPLVAVVPDAVLPAAAEALRGDTLDLAAFANALAPHVEFRQIADAWVIRPLQPLSAEAERAPRKALAAWVEEASRQGYAGLRLGLNAVPTSGSSAAVDRIEALFGALGIGNLSWPASGDRARAWALLPNRAWSGAEVAAPMLPSAARRPLEPIAREGVPREDPRIEHIRTRSSARMLSVRIESEELAGIWPGPGFTPRLEQSRPLIPDGREPRRGTVLRWSLRMLTDQGEATATAYEYPGFRRP